MLADFTAWLIGFVSQFFKDLWDFVADAFVNVFDLFSAAVIGLMGLIPVPSFLVGGLHQFWDALDPGIRFLATSCGIPGALALISAGFIFRLARKVFTLFQW